MARTRTDTRSGRGKGAQRQTEAYARWRRERERELAALRAPRETPGARKRSAGHRATQQQQPRGTYGAREATRGNNALLRANEPVSLRTGHRILPSRPSPQITRRAHCTPPAPDRQTDRCVPSHVPNESERSLASQPHPRPQPQASAACSPQGSVCGRAREGASRKKGDARRGKRNGSAKTRGGRKKKATKASDARERGGQRRRSGDRDR